MINENNNNDNVININEIIIMKMINNEMIMY